MGSYSFGGREYYTETENALKSERVKISEKGGVTEISLNIVFNGKTVPKRYGIWFFEPLVNVYGMWDCLCKYSKDVRADWCRRTSYSRSACGAPVVALYDGCGGNRLTISVSDARNAVEISAGVIEEDGTAKCEIAFFTGLCDKTESYSAVIRLDRRKIPFYGAVRETAEWWKNCGFGQSFVPPAAFEPFYSTWYSFHQDLDADEILSECKIAKRLGINGVIVDDGWHTDGVAKGYLHCGDYKISAKKFPDMKKFVAEAHGLGMKVLLWYPVPYVGFKAENYSRFAGMYLYRDENQGASVLDPRFSQVRSFLTSVYAEAVKTYGYDGLKLDFIDSFRLTDASPRNYEDMDCKSLEEGVTKLLESISAGLKAVNPQIMIEFRQGYIGPAMTEFGNIVRVSDCPNDLISNRIGSIDLRLVTGGAAVHGDMLMWNGGESAEGVSVQLLNTLFAVPQISVRLKSLPKAHIAVLKEYLSLKKRLAPIIYGGRISASAPADNYTYATAESGGDKVTAVYSPAVAAEIDGKRHWLFNAVCADSAVCSLAGAYSANVYDCAGNPTGVYGRLEGIVKLKIPAGGRAEFTAI